MERAASGHVGDSRSDAGAATRDAAVRAAPTRSGAAGAVAGQVVADKVMLQRRSFRSTKLIVGPLSDRPMRAFPPTNPHSARDADRDDFLQDRFLFLIQ